MSSRLFAPGRVIPAALGITALALGALAGFNPQLALAAALGAAFVLIVFADLSVGVALFAFLAFLDSIPDAGDSTVSFAKVAGLLLALSWFATMTTRTERRRDLFVEHAGLGCLIVAFLAWAALSQLWAESSTDALDTTLRYALSLAVLPIAFTALRERKHAVWLVAGYVAGAAISAVYGIVTQPEVTDELGRVAGTLGDPNQLAAVLGAGVVLAAGLAGAAPALSIGRSLALGAATVCLFAAFLTLSRGGLVALGFGFLGALFLGGRWRIHAVAMGTLATLAALCYFALFAPPQATERVLEVDGGTGRTDIWTIGWRMVEDEPIVGVGAGNFQVSSANYLLEPGAIARDEYILDTPKVAHNVYLEVLAELGIVGLALFLAIVVFSLACAIRAARAFEASGERSMELIARSGAIALVVLLAADFFISDQFAKQLWLLLGLGPGLLAIARHEITDSRRRTV